MRYILGNAQHIGSRDSQQDSFGFSDLNNAAFVSHGGFVAVAADGMGGMEHGDAASRTAVRTFLDTYGAKTEQETIPEALGRAVRAANDAVFALSTEFGSVEGIGTTLVAVVICDNLLHWISVGDSNAYLYRDRRLTLLTHPHVFANLLDSAVARGAMTREEASRHPERESLTSYVGTREVDEIDLNSEAYPLRPGDRLLLSSDGLFKTLSVEEMLPHLAAHPQTAAETLVRKTLDKRLPHQDNVTALVIALEDENAPPLPERQPQTKPRSRSLLLWTGLVLLLAAAFALWSLYNK